MNRQQQRIHQHNNIYNTHLQQQQAIYSEHQQEISDSDNNINPNSSQFLDSSSHTAVSSPNHELHRQQQTEQSINLVNQQQQQQTEHSASYAYQQESAKPQLIDQNVSQDFHMHQTQSIEFVGSNNVALHQRHIQSQHIVDQQQYHGLEDLAELAQLSQQQQQQFINSAQRPIFRISGTFF